MLGECECVRRRVSARPREWRKNNTFKSPQIEYILYAKAHKHSEARASADLNTQYHVSKHF